jgi:hypothetical protein
MDKPGKKPLPAPLQGAVAKAKRRHGKRWPAPEIDIVANGDGWDFESPYDDEDAWWKLIGDAFGTCSKAVVTVFISQLSRLVGTNWIAPEGPEERGSLVPDDLELMAALSIVASLKPKNEAEAAFAASIVATHFAAMRMGAEVARRSCIDARTVAALAAINRSYAQQTAAFHQMRGRKGSKNQVITVRKEIRYYDNRQVHLGEGGGNRGSGPHDTAEVRACARGSGRPPERPALPSPDEGGEVVLFPCGEGEAGLPQARRGQRIRRAKG